MLINLLAVLIGTVCGVVLRPVLRNRKTAKQDAPAADQVKRFCEDMERTDYFVQLMHIEGLYPDTRKDEL